jgi:hypothetical protein
MTVTDFMTSFMAGVILVAAVDLARIRRVLEAIRAELAKRNDPKGARP